MVRTSCLVRFPVFLTIFLIAAASHAAAASVTLRWDPPKSSDPSYLYVVEYQVPGAATWAASDPVAGTEVTISGLSDATLYSFRAYTRAGTEQSAPTEVLMAYTAPVNIAELSLQTPYANSWPDWSISIGQPGFPSLYSGNFTISSQGTVSFTVNTALPKSAWIGVKPSAGFLRKVFQVSDIKAANVAPPVVPGDVNGDGLVNAADAAGIVASYGGSAPAANPGRDPNRDGVVNAVDIAGVIANAGGSDDPTP